MTPGKERTNKEWNSNCHRRSCVFYLLTTLLCISWTPTSVLSADKQSSYTTFYSADWVAASKFEVSVPQSNSELVSALCSKLDDKNMCVDDSARVIVVTGEFDFTWSKGLYKEMGCLHNTSSDACFMKGQVELNVTGHCLNMIPVTTYYTRAGIEPLLVGSNKIIVGLSTANMKPRLVGTGLKLSGVKNVEVHNLYIGDINAHLIFGGDAVTIGDTSTNVLLNGLHIRNIGRQMLVVHNGSNSNITVNGCYFDGETCYSAYCDGYHYWMWLLSGNMINIQFTNNHIVKASGRVPHVEIMQINSSGEDIDQAKSLVYMSGNRFEDAPYGLVEVIRSDALVVMEGNKFINTFSVVKSVTDDASVYATTGTSDMMVCRRILGRDCLPNQLINSTMGSTFDPKNDMEAVKLWKSLDHTINPNVTTIITPIQNPFAQQLPMDLRHPKDYTIVTLPTRS